MYELPFPDYCLEPILESVDEIKYKIEKFLFSNRSIIPIKADEDDLYLFLINEWISQSSFKPLTI
jgi:hypothetical protein